MPKLDDIITLAGIMECTIQNTISLPTVQRGFVWKSHQIENLWDSLLRGYPVGAFVLSLQTKAQYNYDLLDGQQRASAICLGFNNPLKSTTDSVFFKISNEQIMIFIDLAKPDFRRDNRKYLFRVITRSHPWGYQRRENQKTLEAKHIRKALCAYGTEGYHYLEKPLKDFWPYDAYKPIPLGLFLNGSDIKSVEKNIKTWRAGKLREVIDKTKREQKDYYSIEEIYGDVQHMLKHQKIPLTYLDFAKLYEDDANATISPDEADSDPLENGYPSTELDQEKVEDRNIDEIENLFIRLNSGGTPLSGEELNYSVLKAHISRPMQRQIEGKCLGLFKAPRFITIAFRLFSVSEASSNPSESLRMRVKPKQFQRTMRLKKDAFIKFLKEHFLNGDLIEKIHNLLYFQKESNPIGLPPSICVSLSEKAPEIMFMLIYRLLVKKDKDTINEKIKPRMLGLVTLFTWLGRGENQKDHRRLLEIIWPCATHFKMERFWSSETVQRAMINDDYELLTPFPRIKDLKNVIPDSNDIRSFAFSKIYKNDYGDFINKIFFNKELILYAQRTQLSEWFSAIEGYLIEDTNRPFDWDHICPHSYIYNKRNVHRALRDWYGSNGNFRAWPYAWNRGDGNLAPKEKLDPEKKEEIDWWRGELKRPGFEKEKLQKYLLEASACDDEWLKVKGEISEKIKETPHAKKVIRCILNRNIKICTEWYKQLHIETLFPEIPKNKENLFDSFLNMKLWKKEDQEDGDLSYALSIKETDIQLYFSFYISGHTIAEDCIYFAFLSENQALGEIKIPKKIEQHYIREDENEIGAYFTLRSYSEQSQIDLFGELHSWLEKFPDKKLQKKTTEAFQRSVKMKYRNRIFDR